MSFQFPEPIPESTNTCSGFGSDHFSFRLDEYHYKLMRHSGPDYDELIVPLSLYAYNRLSPSDQQEQLDEIRSHHEESDFTEPFKELNYSGQVKFLSKVLQKLQCQRLIHLFKQLDPEHQQQVIEQMARIISSRFTLSLEPSLAGRLIVDQAHLNLFSLIQSIYFLEAEINLPRGPEETEDEFRLRRFTQLCNGRTGDAHNLIVACKSGGGHEEEETNEDKDYISNWKSCFTEFFLGFSIIWFQGQWASGQDMLIEQLSEGVAGGVIEKCMQNESEEDFKLRRFRELCKKVLDFRVQQKFLEIAELKLQGWEQDYSRSVLEPQDYDGAANLLCDISTLGFGLLSAKYQQHKIEEMSKQVESEVKTKRHLAAEDMHTTSITDPKEEEAIRMRRFRELFNQVSWPSRIFKELRKVLLKQKHYSEASNFFCGLGPEDQAEMLEKLAHNKMRGSAELISEIFSGGSDEDLRLKRFKQVCIKHLSEWGYIDWPEADKERVLQQGTSDLNEEKSPYAEFLFEVSITWFKARCYNYQRNPIHVILSSKIEVIEKLPDESEEDFRLRRFTDSFNRLELSSQETIVDYIRDELFGGLSHGVLVRRVVLRKQAEGRCSFDSEWIKIKLPNLQRSGSSHDYTSSSISWWISNYNSSRRSSQPYVGQLSNMKLYWT